MHRACRCNVLETRPVARGGVSVAEGVKAQGGAWPWRMTGNRPNGLWQWKTQRRSDSSLLSSTSLSMLVSFA